MSVTIINFRPTGQEWIDYAECAKPDSPYMFPHDRDESGIQLAKEACAVCPVLTECLQGALERGEQWGVWGGLSTEERKGLRARARRVATDTKTPMPTAAQLADAVALDEAAKLLDEVA